MSESNTSAVQEPSDAIAAEIQREYSRKLAQAELKAQAAKAGITLPEGFAGYLDASKLLGEDGQPSTEAIAHVLEPFQPRTSGYTQGIGLGRQSDEAHIPQRHISLDARNR